MLWQHNFYCAKQKIACYSMVAISFGNLFNYWFGFFIWYSLWEYYLFISQFWREYVLFVPYLGSRKNLYPSYWTTKKKEHLHSLSIGLWVKLQRLIFFSYTSTVYCIVMKGFCTKWSSLSTFNVTFVLNTSATGKFLALKPPTT